MLTKEHIKETVAPIGERITIMEMMSSFKEGNTSSTSSSPESLPKLSPYNELTKNTCIEKQKIHLLLSVLLKYSILPLE